MKFKLLLAVLSLIAVCGCHGRHIKGDPVIRPGYGYHQTAPGEFEVFVINTNELKKARVEIGCGVCSEVKVGEVYHITRH